MKGYGTAGPEERDAWDMDSTGPAALRDWVRNPSRDSLAALRTELSTRPEDPHLYAALGIVLAELGEVDAAVDALDQAHYLRPDSAFVLYNYGLALERAGRLREARRRYEAALRLKPDYARVREHLASLVETPLDGSGAFGPLERPATIDASPATSTLALPDGPVCPAGPPRTALAAPGGAEAPDLSPSTRHPLAFPLPVSDDLPPPPVSPEWEPEALPGFLALGQSVLMLWFQQPLLWLGIPAVPATVAAFAVPKGGGWVAALLWLAAFALAAGPLVAAQTAQLVHENPFGGMEEEPARARWLRTGRVAAPLLFLLVAPFCVLLALQVPWEGWLVFLAMLTLTLPLHALLAPSLVRITLHGTSAGLALRQALPGAGRRLWLQLAVMAVFALGLGLLLAFMVLVAQESTRGLGHTVVRALEVGAVSLAASFWGALVALFGLDSLAAEAAEKERAASA